MRDNQNPAFEAPQAGGAANERAWFESFYRATVDGPPEDWMTIGPVCEPEARFHYNAVENAIINALTRRNPIPKMRKVWRFAQSRAAWQVLDIGSGTGHWIDFYRDVYLAAHVTGIELTAQMAEHLRQKYASCPDEVTIFEADVAEGVPAIEPVDVINAIGVMFHIVDDARWHRAVGNLAARLKPEGLMLVGGDFGPETRNVQFHRTDEFESWTEHDTVEGPECRVNKRVRSLQAWHEAASVHGLAVADLVRVPQDGAISTPENDLLVMVKL